MARVEPAAVPSKASKALIYVNSSHDDNAFVRESQRSAASFRQFIPDAVYILHTDAEGFEGAPFDHVVPAVFDVPGNLAHTIHKNGQMVAKLAALPMATQARVLYLGSDTYALRPEVATIFDLLDRFDIVAAHAPLRINDKRGNSPIPEIPPSFPEFNCDLVVFRNTPEVKDFLNRWRDLYLAHQFGHPHDQGAFRYLAYFSDLRIATLPEEYNYRGKTWRQDTVVLQNRDLLDEYLRRQSSGELTEATRPARSLYRGSRVRIKKLLRARRAR
jgi:hypothetical protein